MEKYAIRWGGGDCISSIGSAKDYGQPSKLKIPRRNAAKEKLARG